MSIITKEVKESLAKEYEQYAESLRLNRLVNPEGIKTHKYDGRGDYERDGNGGYVFVNTPIEDTKSFDEWTTEKVAKQVNSEMGSFANRLLNDMGYDSSNYVVANAVNNAIVNFLVQTLAEL